MTEVTKPDARHKRWLGWLGRTEIPLAVYAVIFSTMALLWIIQEIHPDLTLGLLTELMGAAFTLFIIDTLLVRSKTRRWKIVQEHMDYLIARNINRLRDGIAVRALGFNPVIEAGQSETIQRSAIREQRARLLDELEQLSSGRLARRLAEDSLFTENTYAYLEERADDLWAVLNMKYSEYLAPELVSALMRLHTHVKDLGGHVRQYGRAELFPEDAAYYRQIGRMGAGVSVREVLRIVNRLKRQGYSEPAALSDTELADKER